VFFSEKLSRIMAAMVAMEAEMMVDMAAMAAEMVVDLEEMTAAVTLEEMVEETLEVEETSSCGVPKMSIMTTFTCNELMA
jgi:hypothetical protein